MVFNKVNVFIIKSLSGNVKTTSSSLFRPLFIRRSFATDMKSHQTELMKRGLPKQKPIQGVKHIVLVSSGKGGVGKSTTATNIAVAINLLCPEKKVGLLDADIFGPSIPLMMNLHDTPFLTEKKQMEPLVNYGVKCMSFGFLIDEGAPVVWRGLMVMQALEKLMRQVNWGEIDYLIVDTPPGTGDIHLSLVQNLPIDGVVIVTTPQYAAVEVTKRGAVMYTQLNIPIIGIVDNMSVVKCPSCSNNISVFGDATRNLAEGLNIDVLEKFPLDTSTSDGCDKGVPIVLNSSTTQSVSYKNLARKILDFLSLANKEQRGVKAIT